MSTFINKDTYIGDTGKKLSDLIPNDLITPVLIYQGYITPSSGTVNVGSFSNYKRLLIVLGANSSYTSLEIPVSLLPRTFAANWQALDNRLANYYCTFSLSSNGDVNIVYSGYNRVDLNYDNERNYGITEIYGYKY